MQREAWDAALQELRGHLVQSWRWGEYKRSQGWQVERIRIDVPGGTGMAQVLFRHRGAISLAYIPRGPVIRGEARPVFTELMDAVDAACRRHGAISLIVEPNERLPLKGTYKSVGFVRSSRHFEPRRTVKVPLLDDEALLARMRQDTRYNIRYAQRHGVTAERAKGDTANLAVFYQLLQNTSQRNDWPIHSRAYYDEFFRLFADDALLSFAVVDGQPVVGLMAVRFGEEAIYYHGASSTPHRVRGAAAYLQFEAMRWAREQGCRQYDLRGLPAEVPPPSGDTPPTRGSDLRGMYQYKTGFGGDIVSYPPPMERRYRPFLSWLARRVMDRIYS